MQSTKTMRFSTSIQRRNLYGKIRQGHCNSSPDSQHAIAAIRRYPQRQQILLLWPQQQMPRMLARLIPIASQRREVQAWRIKNDRWLQWFRAANIESVSRHHETVARRVEKINNFTLCNDTLWWMANEHLGYGLWARYAVHSDLWLWNFCLKCSSNGLAARKRHLPELATR